MNFDYQMLGGLTIFHCISGNDRHILLFYKKYHFCNLLPFAKAGQSREECPFLGMEPVVMKHFLRFGGYITFGQDRISMQKKKITTVRCIHLS